MRMCDLKLHAIFLLTFSTVEEPRPSFISEDVAEFDLTSTGKLVLPTYPLRGAFEQELRKQIKEGRFSV